jgi:hypothetical protein
MFAFMYLSFSVCAIDEDTAPFIQLGRARGDTLMKTVATMLI